MNQERIICREVTGEAHQRKVPEIRTEEGNCGQEMPNIYRFGPWVVSILFIASLMTYSYLKINLNSIQYLYQYSSLWEIRKMEEQVK